MFEGGTAEGLPFSNHLVIQGLGSKPFSLHGDSGAVVVDQCNRLVGILRGGTFEASLVTPWSLLKQHCDVEYQAVQEKDEI